MDDDDNYKLINGDENKKNENEEQKDKETSYLINTSANNNTNQNSNNITNISFIDIINRIINIFPKDNMMSKFIISSLLFHPISNLIISKNDNVKKICTKSERRFIKRILITFMIFNLIGFFLSNSGGGFSGFFIKLLLIIFILIHTNFLKINNLEELKQFLKNKK